MKLRFHKNSLRLRLSQSEVAQLSEHGWIEDRVDFPDGRTLSFGLETGESNSARFDEGAIRIIAPRPEVRHWIESDQEGIEYQSGPLKIAIEKDFQCLHRASPEDADTFPNPMVDKF
jgi:hypothetical protein